MGSPSAFPVFLIITLFAVLQLAKFAVCHGSPNTLTFQDYWNLMLHDTPMPSAVRDHLIDEPSAIPTGSKSHRDHTDPVLLRRGGATDGNKKPGGRHDVVLGVNGKPVPVDLHNKPFLFYTKYNENNKKPGGRHDVVLGVNGKPVTVDLDNKPLLIYPSYNENNKKPGGRHDVVLGVNGKPVTVDLDNKPLLIYPSYNENNKKLGGLHGTKLPVEGGVGGAAHHDRDDDVIDNPNARNFFLEKDLHVGAKLVAFLDRGLSGDAFLHREVADGIPFSSQETMEILRRFGVQPGSPMANKLEEMIGRCEEQGNAEDMLFCATSFESMVDYVLSSMGTGDLETLTTSVADSGRGNVPPAPEQVYTVRSWAVVSTPNTTATSCHVVKYPYTIFHCHRIPRSRTYVLKMVGEDGTAVDAATICHTDTSKWSPTYYVLKVFGLRPGEETICHLMPDGDVTWLPRRGGRAAAAAASL